MPNEVSLLVNGKRVTVPAGATVAVAMISAGQACRKSVSGEPRGPMCGMGVCFECRATINGMPHSLTCRIVCEPGMEVSTNE